MDWLKIYCLKVQKLEKSEKTQGVKKTQAILTKQNFANCPKIGFIFVGNLKNSKLIPQKNPLPSHRERHHKLTQSTFRLREMGLSHAIDNCPLACNMRN